MMEEKSQEKSWNFFFKKKVELNLSKQKFATRDLFKIGQ